MNTSPQQSSPRCIFASRDISAREAFLQHGVFGKRLDFGVNKAESEFFNNIIYLFNIDRYMFTVYYPLAGRGNQGRKEDSSGGSVVGKQLTANGARAPGVSLCARGGPKTPRRTPLGQKLGTFIRMLASERDGEDPSAPNIGFKTARSPKALGMILRRRRSSTNSRSSKFVVRMARRWVAAQSVLQFRTRICSRKWRKRAASSLGDREPAQDPVPVQHESRTAHAAQCHHWAH